MAFQSPGYNYLCLDRTSPPPPPPYPSKYEWERRVCHLVTGASTYDRVSRVGSGISSHQFVQHSSPPNTRLPLPSSLDFCRRLPLLLLPIVRPPLRVCSSHCCQYCPGLDNPPETRVRANKGQISDGWRWWIVTIGTAAFSIDW